MSKKDDTADASERQTGRAKKCPAHRFRRCHWTNRRENRRAAAPERASSQHPGGVVKRQASRPLCYLRMFLFCAERGDCVKGEVG